MDIPTTLRQCATVASPPCCAWSTLPPAHVLKRWKSTASALRMATTGPWRSISCRFMGCQRACFFRIRVSYGYFSHGGGGALWGPVIDLHGAESHVGRGVRGRAAAGAIAHHHRPRPDLITAALHEDGALGAVGLEEAAEEDVRVHASGAV